MVSACPSPDEHERLLWKSWRGRPARCRAGILPARERDAPATAGETPAPHPSTVGPFFVVSGCPSADEHERLPWNRRSHPFHVYAEKKR